MSYALDASALMAYLEKEPGYLEVHDVFVDAAEFDRKILMNIVNWGEVYYILMRDYGMEKAEAIAKIVDTFPIQIIPPNHAITRQAAIYKTFKKLPYMDSHAAAFAKIHKATLLTADREFSAVSREIKIIWVK